MSNIFDYKPELEYVLQDINTIDNLQDKRIDAMKTFIINGATPVLEKAEEVKQLLNEVQARIEKKLESVTAPFSMELDDILREKVSVLKDSSRLINDGVITYPLYKAAKDDPLLSIIEDAWDEYHCGIDGIVEAEILPYVEIIGNVLDNVWSFINNALLYDEEPTTRASAQKLKESELLQVEKYMYLQDEIGKASIEGDKAQYIALKKQFDAIENKLKYRRNMNLILSDVLTRMINITQDLYDSTIPEFHRIQYEALSDQLGVINQNAGTNSLSTKTIVYAAFADQYANVLNLKRNYRNVISDNVRNRTFKNAIQDARLYRDVAVPSMIELSYIDESLPVQGAGDVIISGIERVTKLYQHSILGAKNMLESDTNVINSLINQVYEKYRTRVTYKIIGS